MTREEWVASKIKALPTFDGKDAAIHAAIKANKDMAVNEVWKEPADRGGKYVVAAPEAFEALYNEKYERILDAGALCDIERGEHTDEIEEV